MYADNIQFYRNICIEDIRLFIDSINDDLQKIYNWANANGLCINPSKSKCLLFSRTKRPFDVADIIIRGNKIDFVESASNLGVIFNGPYRLNYLLFLLTIKTIKICFKNI